MTTGPFITSSRIAQNPVDACDQLAGVERLGDVVVGAERETLYHFGFVMMRADQDYRRLPGCCIARAARSSASNPFMCGIDTSSSTRAGLFLRAISSACSPSCAMSHSKLKCLSIVESITIVVASSSANTTRRAPVGAARLDHHFRSLDESEDAVCPQQQFLRLARPQDEFAVEVEDRGEARHQVLGASR